MPRPQAGAAVEVVNEAMRNLVTSKHFNAELDRRFTKLESKVDRRFTRLETKIETAVANLGRSQAWGFVYMSGLTITVAALLFTALQLFSPGGAVSSPAWDVPPDSAPPLDTQPDSTDISSRRDSRPDFTGAQ